MIARILNIVVHRNKLKFYLLSKNREKFTYVMDLPFKDFCYGSKSEAKKVQEIYADKNIEIERMPDHYKFVKFIQRDEPVYKIKFPSVFMKTKVRKVMELEHGILLSEADIPYVDLVMHEMGLYAFVEVKDGTIYPASKPDDFPPLRIAYCDYETDDRQEVLQESKFDTFAKPDVSRIISCSIHDGEKAEFYTHDDEAVLLQQIADRLNDFDVTQWWNGEEFDYKFDLRFKMHKIKNYDPNKWIRLDAMRIHEMLNSKERGFVSLDMAGFRHLGIRKIQHKWGFWEAFQHHRDELEVYNNRDVVLMHLLEEKFGFANIVLQSAEKIGFLPQRYTYSRYSSIQAIMRLSRGHYGKRFVWKSKSEIPITDAYEGATVFESMAGVWKNVIAIDLASLYNNIIQTWNISNEQLMIYEDGSHDYTRFDHEGIMSRVLRVFEKDRDMYKKLRNSTKDEDKYKLYDQIQAGLKVVLLSIYGGLGARGSTVHKATGKTSGAKSFYNFYCANDVTKFAREIIEKAKEVCEGMGYKVIYGDTDSLFLYIGDDDLDVDSVSDILESIVDAVNQEYGSMFDMYSIPEERRKIKMEAQGWYSPFVLFGKKKYYFAREVYNAENKKYYEDVHMYGKGIKYIKLSEAQFIRDFQKEIYKDVLLYKPYSVFKTKVRETYERFMNGEYDDKLVFETKLARKTSEYTTSLPHVKLAEKLITQGKMAEKSTIFYTIGYVDIDGKPVAVPEGDPIYPSGRMYIWDHRVKGWLNEIEKLVYIPMAQTNINDYFG